NTIAKPGLGGRARSSWVNASSPPAEAPIATTAIRGSAVLVVAPSSFVGGGAALASLGLEDGFARRDLATRSYPRPAARFTGRDAWVRGSRRSSPGISS